MRDLAAAAEKNAGESVAPTGLDVVARVDASSKLGEGQQGELWLDTSRLHLFDPATGQRLKD
jgi:multiple sugar transport system ATP-binding protein